MISASQKLSFLFSIVILLSSFPCHSRDWHSPLDEIYEKLVKDLEQVRTEVSDPSKKWVVNSAVMRMKSDANAALSGVPVAAAKLKIHERSEFLKGYKSAVDTLIDKIDRLSDAVKKGDSAAAGSAVDEIKKSWDVITKQYLAEDASWRQSK